MKDLAEIILELLINACDADAKTIDFDLTLDTINQFTIKDDGCGISDEQLKDITSPFNTRRSSRKLGFGLAFFAQAIQQAEGVIDIQSTLNQGTLIHASYNSKHIDACPLGNMGESIAFVLQRNPNLDLTFTLHQSSLIKTFRSREVRDLIHPLSINEIEILKWIENTVNSLFIS